MGRESQDTGGRTRRLHVSVLGPVRAWWDEQEVELGPARQRALLAALLLRPTVTVSAEGLLDAVWGERPPASGTRVVPVYVYRLRRCLARTGVPAPATVLRSQRGGYRFDDADASIDAARLTALLAAADAARDAGDAATAVDRYGTAVRLFTGEPLAGVPGPYAAAERLRLTERRAAALRSRLDAQLTLGAYAEMVDDLATLTPAYPHDEQLAGLLMRALHGLGRRADALDVFTAFRARLITELGVEPGAELHRVQREVLTGDAPAACAPLRTAPTTAPTAHAAATTAHAPGPAAPLPETAEPTTHAAAPRAHAPGPSAPSWGTADGTTAPSARRTVQSPGAAAEPAATAGTTAIAGATATVGTTGKAGATGTVGTTGTAGARGAAGAAGPPGSTEPSAPEATAVPDELPGNAGELVGRDRELCALVGGGDAGLVSVVVVTGVAGAGKTALATRAAHALRPGFPDGCLFVDLHGHTAIQRGLPPERLLRRLLAALGVGADGLPDELDELVARWRSATAHRRLLVVLDDATSTEQVRPALPSGAGSRVLVTSRNRLAGLDAAHRVTVEPLPDEESVRLLGRLVGAERAAGEPAAVRELARLCGGLPLALCIAGTRLHNRPMWTVGHLVGRVADEQRRLGELTAEDRGVEAALAPSYDHLPAEQQRAFRMLGLSPTVEVDGLVLAAMLGWSVVRAERALEALVDASLVQQPSAGRYRLHDLVGVYARRLADDDPAESVAAARTGVLRLYLAAARCAADHAADRPGPDAAPFPDRGTATGWLDATGGGVVDVVSHAVAVGRPGLAGEIAEALVDYLTRQGRYRECQAVLRIALAAADRTGDRRLAASLRIGLGNVFGMQADYPDAERELDAALRIAVAAGDRRQQARALGGLATAARSVGRDRDAADRLAALMELARDLSDDRLTGMALCNLGVVEHQLGSSVAALDRLADATRLGEDTDDPRLAGNALCHAGGVLLDLDRYAEAAVRLRRAIGYAERAGDRPLRAFAQTRLATAEQRLGHHATALALHHTAAAATTDQPDTELGREVADRLAAHRRRAGDPAAPPG